MRPVLLAAAILVTGIAVACLGGDGENPDNADGTRPSATTTTPAPDDGALPDAVADLLRAVDAHDPGALYALMRPTRMRCDTRGPLGGAGPGSCPGNPKAGVPPLPPDAIVDVYVESSCELELDEEDGRALAERALAQIAALYAVVRFDRNVFEPEPYLPAGSDFGVVFDTSNGAGLVLVVHEDAVVLFDYLCVAPPSSLLDGHPRYGMPTVIFRGPAFAD